MAQVIAMRPTVLKPNARLIAVLLGLVYLWMSTIVQLRHTDDYAGLRTFAGHAPSVTASTGGHGDEECLAHKWSDAAQMLCAAMPHATSFEFIRLPQAPAIPAALHISAFSYTALRAPPSIA